MKMMRFTETALAESQPAEGVLTPAVRTALLPVARRVFWWSQPNDWLDDPARFVAQVMTYGDWNDTTLALELLGEASFKQVLQNPPAGVFDIKSWVYWHHRFQLEAPPLPGRGCLKPDVTAHFEILPPPQLALWPDLAQIPGHFVLYGGTALALRLGHRQSLDFYFFTAETMNPGELLQTSKS